MPNDPRGSTSRTIESDLIAELGERHCGRKRVQPSSRTIREFYGRAAAVLKHDLLELSPKDREIVAASFAETIRRQRYTCYACAIMRDHVHVCIRKHKHQAEEMIGHLQEDSRLALAKAGLRNADHPLWGGPGWKVFLDSTEDVLRTVRYVQENPTKAGWPAQLFPLVTAYNNWPLQLR